MIKRIVPHFLGKPELGYQEMGSGRRFRRIYSGICWPRGNLGAVVVVAEAFSIDAGLGERKLRVLAEYENRNPSELIDRCNEHKEFMCIENVYGDTGNRPMMTFLRNSKANFSLSKAPFVDESAAHEAYLLLIREKISKIKSVLIFGESSAIGAILESINSIPAGDSFKSDFPKIAALGYALSALVLLTPPKPMPLAPTYDALDPGVGY